MQDDDAKKFFENNALIKGLDAVPRARRLVAAELRDMAEAARPDYRQFSATDPWIRNLWRAAADFLEEA
jgi:hypothetical protein